MSAVLYHDGEDVGWIENQNFRVQVEFDWDSEDLCAICGDYDSTDHDDTDHVFTQPEWEPNSMFFARDEEGDCHVGISVGDPRGAFVMTIRNVNGRLIMHVPHPNQGWLHRDLEEIHVGTYEIS